MPKSAQKQRGCTHLLTLWLSGCAALFFSNITSSAETADNTPPIPISIIIDDLGDLPQNGLRAVQLPGKVTCAFLPHTRHSKSLAQTAHRLGKEVMIHMPMESMENMRLGPGALTAGMTQQKFKQTLKAGIAAIPYASGLNNHMGSRLTRNPAQMQWLMEALKENGRLFFIDSRTTAETVALKLAQENRIPSRKRDIFLDDDASADAIAYQFQRLIRTAKREGSAIAIGHPNNNTLDLLEQQLPRLHALGLKLVPVSELLNAPRPPEQHLADDSESRAPDTQLVYNYRPFAHGHRPLELTQ